MSSERTRIYLCRHARTRLNADGLLRGHLDAHLDPAGRREAEDLGKALRSMAPLRVLSSPLTRAVQTAQAVATHTDAEVQIDLRLRPLGREASQYSQGYVRQHRRGARGRASGQRSRPGAPSARRPACRRRTRRRGPDEP
jgi:phosphohistidine phosphatase SixA